MNITDRMLLILQEKKLKASDLAKFLDINQSNISTWKKRNTNPPSEYLLQICEFMGVSVEYLLSGKVDTKRTEPRQAEPDASIEKKDFDSPFWDLLTEDERELLSMYGYLTKEGKTWARYIIKGYLKEHKNLSSSRQLGAEDESGKTA